MAGDVILWTLILSFLSIVATTSSDPNVNTEILVDIKKYSLESKTDIEEVKASLKKFFEEHREELVILDKNSQNTNAKIDKILERLTK
mgnify:CR=1 FL=1